MHQLFQLSVSKLVDESNTFDYYCHSMCIILLMFMLINAPDSHGLVHSAGFPDRWSMANWWWAAEIGVDQGKGACTRTVSSCTAKQCEWVWEQLSRDNQEGFFFNFSGKIPKYLYRIIKSLYRYFICEIIFKKPTSNNSLVCRVMHLKTRT